MREILILLSVIFVTSSWLGYLIAEYLDESKPRYYSYEEIKKKYFPNIKNEYDLDNPDLGNEIAKIIIKEFKGDIMRGDSND